MPSATPLPRGPSHLALFGAEDLLRSAGCPVCRYVAEAGDRFLIWFALEAHAEASMITRLCRSLGLCAAHTRGLLSQPGAEGRMTAVYRYLLRAAAGYLAAGTSPPAPCPACARDAEGAQRALDTLLTGLREEDLHERYRDVGGLCLPHLRAAMPRSGRRLAAWLAEEMISRLAGPPVLAVIGGERDADADVRARLRAALPAAPAADGPGSGDVCPVCLTAAVAERDVLAQAGAGLCPAHLHDAYSSLADSPGLPNRVAQLLALPAERSVAWLAEQASPSTLGSALKRLTDRGRGSRDRTAPCPACGAASAAANRLLETVPAARAPRLCLRHVMSLREHDRRGADAAVRAAAHRTEDVLGELEESFRKRAWAHRHEPRGQEMTAWRRAAALIDGRVYGGGPPGPL